MKFYVFIKHSLEPARFAPAVVELPDSCTVIPIYTVNGRGETQAQTGKLYQHSSAF